MISSDIRQTILTDELQLGNRLNLAVKQGNRAEFSLLLSMLTADVLDFPEFALKEPQVTIPAEQNLRSEFSLRGPEVLRGKGISPEKAKAMSEQAHQLNMTAIRFEQAVNPEPLCNEQALGGVDADVLDNISLLAKLKHMEKVNKVAPEPAQLIQEKFNQVLEGFDYEKDLKVTYFNKVA